MTEPVPSRPNTSSGGVLIVGLDRPELIEQVFSEHPPRPDGFSAPIYLIDPDAARAGALLDEGIITESSRVRLFTGGNCIQDAHAYLGAHLERPLPRQIVASGPHVAGIARRLAAGIDELARKQTRATESIRTNLGARWALRGMDHWRDRFKSITDGDRARVLIVTTRYSTFIQHACADLAEAFTANGHEARLLREPDTHSTITPLLCMNEIDAFDPDLIVVSNYPRLLHWEIFPEGWPHVCWIQDAMAHLFRPLNAEPSPLDFVAGHIYPGAAALTGYPESTRLEFPVPISETKFHPAPVTAAQQNAFRCDIAYVSHQSQTPDSFHRRFISQLPPENHECIERARQRITDAINAWDHPEQDQVLAAIKRDLAGDLGRNDDQTLLDTLWSQYIHPIAELLLRHEMLGWAAEVARDHGLTLRLFGNGWDKHPSLSIFAAGPIPHGEDLRACYQLAGVHLHASMSGCAHQRVFECALSGGLALSRRSWGEFYRQDWYRMCLFFESDPEPDASLVEWKLPAFVIENHPTLKSIIKDRARMVRPPRGWDHEHLGGVYARVEEDESIEYWWAPLAPEQMRLIELLGDPFETTFSTRAELEQRILHAVGDRSWRDARSAEIAARTRQRISMARFADRLLDTVCKGMANEDARPLAEASA